MSGWHLTGGLTHRKLALNITSLSWGIGMVVRLKKFMLGAASLMAASVIGASGGWAMSMSDAVRIAVESNPEIGEAIANREAIEFELRQGRGLYLPRIDLEGSLGAEIRDSRSTHQTGDNDHVFFRKEGSVVIRQLLFDGFGTDAEVERQASRVDGASHRVFERSEFVALAVIREYLDIIRLRRVVSISKNNVAYHRRLVGRIGEGAAEGSLSVADRQQAQERLYAAKARVAEAREELKAAEARFIRLVGRNAGKVSVPRRISRALPATKSHAIGTARASHPSVKLAKADIDAATALVKAAESRYYPKFTLEGRARAGHNLSGFRGHDHDAQANVVMSWNIYNGGIDTANRQEQIRRVDEQRKRLHRITREVEEAVRLSWDRRDEQRRRLAELRRQHNAIVQLVRSYTEQFNIGQRSLLDLLDTQNTRVSARIAVETADAAVKFAEYRILASTGTLLRTMSVKAPTASDAYAREMVNVPPTPPAETQTRYSPKRDGSLGPLY